MEVEADLLQVQLPMVILVQPIPVALLLPEVELVEMAEVDQTVLEVQEVLPEGQVVEPIELVLELLTEVMEQPDR
jgi:hypothetical protein